VKHIKKKIGKAKFFELVGLLKTVRELQLPKPPLLAQQIKSDNITYIIQTTNDNQEFNRLTSEPVKDLSQSETE
jgi:predicted Zn-dependent protease